MKMSLLTKLSFLVLLFVFQSAYSQKTIPAPQQGGVYGSETSNDQYNQSGYPQSSYPGGYQQGGYQQGGYSQYRIQRGTPACPFSSNPDSLATINQLRSSIEAMRNREGCQSAVQISDSLSANLSAIAEMDNDFSCTQLEAVTREYEYTMSISGSDLVLSDVPSAYQSCITTAAQPGKSGPTISGVDSNCVSSVFASVRSGYDRSCRESVRVNRSRFNERNTVRALYGATGTLASMIENPQCSGRETVGGLANAGVQTLPLLASSIPGYGYGLAIGAQLISSIFGRLLSGENNVDRINDLLGEENARCLHLQAMSLALRCNDENNSQNGNSGLEASWVAPIASLSIELEKEENRNMGSIARALETQIQLPDGSRRTLNDLLNQIRQNLSADTSQVAQYQVSQIDRLLNINMSRGLEGEALTEVAPALIEGLGSLYPNNKIALDAAWEGARTSAGTSIPRRDPNNNLNNSLGRYSLELLRSSRDRYGLDSLSSLQSTAHSSDSGNELSFRSSAMLQRFNICAYNSFLLLSDEGTLRSRVSDQQSILGAIDYSDGSNSRSRMAQFRQGCEEFNCIINIPRGFQNADAFKSWQCNILTRQPQIRTAINTKISEWESRQGTGSLCPTDTNTDTSSGSSRRRNQ